MQPEFRHGLLRGSGAFFETATGKRLPTPLYARRSGTAMAVEVSRQARAALAAGGVRSAAGRRAIDDMDRGLRDARHTANPGTAADLTAAAIFVALLGGGWSVEPV